MLCIVGCVDGDGWKLQSEYATALTLASVVAAEELDRRVRRITRLERRLANELRNREQ